MLTFDKIRELERTERDAKKLQGLPEDIIEQLNDYIQRKEKIKEKTTADIRELEHVRNTIKSFFEMREHKITQASMDTVRTGLPPENLTRHEERIFYELVEALKRHREQFFHEIAKERKHEEKPVYRVKKSLPEFVGPDMKTYKLNENELITLPKELEAILLKEGVIERAE